VKTRSQALRDLGLVIAEIAAQTDHLTPLEAAERAWRPDGPPVDVLAAQIAAGRELIAA
jgi:hypothetical protein